MIELHLLFSDQQTNIEREQMHIQKQQDKLSKIQEEFNIIMHDIGKKLYDDKKRLCSRLEKLKQMKNIANTCSERAKDMLKTQINNVLIRPACTTSISNNAVISMQKEYEDFKKSLNSECPVVETTQLYVQELYQSVINQFNMKEFLLMKNETCFICTEKMTSDTMQYWNVIMSHVEVVLNKQSRKTF